VAGLPALDRALTDLAIQCDAARATYVPHTGSIHGQWQ
jgi:hypothetical protein